MPAFKPPGDCPVCGDFVPKGLVSCPSCGSCAKSGWNEDADYDGLDLPDAPEDFDYDDFVEREFGGRKKSAHLGKNGSLWWWVAVVLIIIAVVSLILTGRF